MQEFILALALLTTESSYKSEVERPATKVEDTIQFWFGAEGPWRIRTYAIDHDIHIYSIDSSFTEESAQAHIAKHYAEVLKKQYVIRFKDTTDADAIEKALRAVGLQGTLEVAQSGFAFYNPDSGKYKTQSEPK
jgi:hypothetical protein